MAENTTNSEIDRLLDEVVCDEESDVEDDESETSLGLLDFSPGSDIIIIGFR